MKSSRVLLCCLLVAMPGAAFAQSDPQNTFAALKNLAGSWVGAVTTQPAMPDMGPYAQMRATLRVTSRGNALVHEMQGVGNADDPTKYDHPLTMFYLNDGQLTLTHYCDAGNRPRMVAHASADGKTVDFDFVDVAGSTQRGHMHHAKFTFIDQNHHIEEWTYLMPGDKPVIARMDFKRERVADAGSGK